MNDKSAHKNYCENYNGTLNELSVDIGAMTHQARAELFTALAVYVSNQHISDLARGRVKYAKVLKEIADLLQDVANAESRAWDICHSRTQVIGAPTVRERG